MAKRASISVRRRAWWKFYGQDWRADAPLRMCSFGARGLWIDMLSLMHESAAVGFLLVNGVPPSPRQLVGLLGGAEKEIGKLLAELKAANVYSITGQDMPEDLKALIPTGMPDGVLFSRRMVRDEAKAMQDRENGRTGGNPNLPARDIPEGNELDNPPVKAGVNPQANPQIPDARREAPSGLPPEGYQSPRLVAARGGDERPTHDAVQGIVAGLTAAKVVRA